MGDEYLKLNIVQNGNQLCGYTFDFVLKDKKAIVKRISRVFMTLLYRFGQLLAGHLSSIVATMC